jgi:superoxide dismutase
MGKKRITELLDQLHATHQADIENTAAIFTVAQVAVNQLSQQVGNDFSTPAPAFALSPAAVTKEKLKQQYGSFNACRKAAKQAGIRFHGNPTWEHLVTAFSYFETIQNLIHTYVTSYPNPNLQSISIEFKLE